MATVEEVLIHFQGVDNVSPTVQQIDSVLGGAMGNATAQSGGLMNSMRELGGIFQGLNGLVMGVFGTMGLSTFKNMTYGMATARQEIKSLFDSVYHSDQDPSALKLWENMDELTNQGYVQLDDLSNAMNNFAMVTGASADESERMATVVNKLGNIAILMGMDSYRTTAVMNSAVQGMNGNLNMLQKNLGIGKKRLEDMGWSGKASDVEGYTAALEKAISAIDTSDLLDSTEGRVISLQKKFRIAGRNLGNYMLPPINAILDAFTQLNAQSNDLFASLIIIGTGAMSGFASILPTLSPLIQLYDFLEKQSLDFNVKGLGSLIQTRTVTGRLLANTKDLIASPVAGWIRYWTRSNLLPYIDDLWFGMRRLYLSNVVYTNSFARLTSLSNNFTSRFLSGVGSISQSIGSAQRRLAEFVATYGSLEGRANIIGRLANQSARLEQFGTRLKEWTPSVNLESMRSQAFQLPKVSMETARSQGFMTHMKDNAILNQLNQERKALQMNRIEQEKNRLERQRGILATLQNALGLGTDTARTVTNTAAKEFNVGMTLAERTAKADANKQQAIGNLLRLEEMGIIQKDALYMGLYNLGILSEAETRALVSKETWAEMGAKSGLLGINISLAGINTILLAQVLLIVGAIILVIMVIDQIGKTLGWWDNWKEMLDAIVKGLQRIWQAFINNPNVQGFINDIKWVFGQLGGTIQWVAWQVLQFFGWKDDGSEVDIVRGIIDVFGALGDILGKIVNAVKWFFTVTAPIWQAIFTAATIPIRALIGLLKGIYCIIMGCSPGIIPALQTLASVFRTIWSGLASFISNPIGTIVRALQSWQSLLFNVARNIGSSIWNGLNSVLGGMPQRVWQIFWNMLNNIKRIPQMIWGTAQDIGQQAYNGLDSAVSGLTGGAIHLPGATNRQQNAQQNARIMGNATKNYNNSRNARGGHTINIGAGAIQLDARNLTTKESKQIMINALEGLTTYETVHTKKAQGGK